MTSASARLVPVRERHVRLGVNTLTRAAIAHRANLSVIAKSSLVLASRPNASIVKARLNRAHLAEIVLHVKADSVAPTHADEARAQEAVAHAAEALVAAAVVLAAVALVPAARAVAAKARVRDSVAIRFSDTLI